MVWVTAENPEFVSFLFCTPLRPFTRSASVMGLGTALLVGFAVLFFLLDVADALPVDVDFLDAKSEPPSRDSLSIVQLLWS